MLANAPEPIVLIVTAVPGAHLLFICSRFESRPATRLKLARRHTPPLIPADCFRRPRRRSSRRPPTAEGGVPRTGERGSRASFCEQRRDRLRAEVELRAQRLFAEKGRHLVVDEDGVACRHHGRDGAHIVERPTSWRAPLTARCFARERREQHARDPQVRHLLEIV